MVTLWSQGSWAFMHIKNIKVSKVGRVGRRLSGGGLKPRIGPPYDDKPWEGLWKACSDCMLCICCSLVDTGACLMLGNWLARCSDMVQRRGCYCWSWFVLQQFTVANKSLSVFCQLVVGHCKGKLMWSGLQSFLTGLPGAAKSPHMAGGNTGQKEVWTIYKNLDIFAPMKEHT